MSQSAVKENENEEDEFGSVELVTGGLRNSSALANHSESLRV